MWRSCKVQFWTVRSDPEHWTCRTTEHPPNHSLGNSASNNKYKYAIYIFLNPGLCDFYQSYTFSVMICSNVYLVPSPCRLQMKMTKSDYMMCLDVWYSCFINVHCPLIWHKNTFSKHVMARCEGQMFSQKVLDILGCLNHHHINVNFFISSRQRMFFAKNFISGIIDVVRWESAPCE